MDLGKRGKMMRDVVRGVLVIALAGVSAGTVTGCTSVYGNSAVEEELSAEGTNAAFEGLGQSYLDILTEENPVYGTQLGDHAHDSDLPDVSAEGRRRSLQLLRGIRIALRTIDEGKLTPDNRVDYAMLKNALDYQLWSAEELQEWAWNPQYYGNIASYSIYGLVARDFAPWPQRFESIVERMEKLPSFLEQARAQIDVARVPKIHAETVAKQNAGLMGLIDATLLPEIESQGSDRGRFDVAYSNLKEAMADHQNWLDDVVVPGAQGEFRMDPQNYERKMQFALETDMSVAELKAKAEAAYTQTRQQMHEVSLKIGDCASRGLTGSIEINQQRVIECGLEASYENRASRDGLEEAARKTLADAEAFTKARNIVRMAGNETQIITMPKFFQGNSVAYLDAPAPLEKHLPAYYAVSPVPEDWTEEQATSFLKEYNISMLHLLSIHEGTPGHALQLDHANKNESVLRAVLQSGPFIEGWAVYSERVMAEEGYLGGMETEQGRFFLLNGLKFRLRAITNTLLDISIHTDGMTRDQAMDLMMRGAFQQEREAAGKWVRANLTSVQLLSYYTGYEEHLALRREAEERWGDEFALRKYHDEVLSHGSPPAKYVRQLMFGE